MKWQLFNLDLSYKVKALCCGRALTSQQSRKWTLSPTQVHYHLDKAASASTARQVCVVGQSKREFKTNVWLTQWRNIQIYVDWFMLVWHSD